MHAHRITWFGALAVSAYCYLAPHVLGRDPATPLPVVVEASGSKEVDSLVRSLVSARPAPYPSGHWPPFEIGQMYATPEVTNAIALLKKKGPSIFPYLVHHLHDDRYCYSTTMQAVDNRTVGDAVLNILCEQYWSPYVKARETPQGRCSSPTFSVYLREKGESQWAQWAKDKTRLQIQLDFIDWCVATEEKRGFVDAVQRTNVLSIYEAQREASKSRYSEPDGSAKKEQWR